MHIFITGGTKGIGKGLVIEFLKKGHEVSFTGTSIESISLAEKDFSGTFSGYVCDVRDFNSIVKAKDEAVEKYNCIDIWINNAGVDQERGVVSDLSPEGIKRVIDINVTGMINGTSVALKEMRGQNFGVVYNMDFKSGAWHGGILEDIQIIGFGNDGVGENYFTLNGIFKFNIGDEICLSRSESWSL